MNSDKIEGVMDKVVGKTQEVAGDVTGDERPLRGGCNTRKIWRCPGLCQRSGQEEATHHCGDLCRREFIGWPAVTSPVTLY